MNLLTEGQWLSSPGSLKESSAVFTPHLLPMIKMVARGTAGRERRLVMWQVPSQWEQVWTQVELNFSCSYWVVNHSISCPPNFKAWMAAAICEPRSSTVLWLQCVKYGGSVADSNALWLWQSPIEASSWLTQFMISFHILRLSSWLCIFRGNSSCSLGICKLAIVLIVDSKWNKRGIRLPEGRLYWSVSLFYVVGFPHMSCKLLFSKYKVIKRRIWTWSAPWVRGQRVRRYISALWIVSLSLLGRWQGSSFILF